jgi:hypothetical protein
MDRFAARFADLLESTAGKVRSLTIDRAERSVRIVALALPAIVLGALAVVFLFMTIHGALAVALGAAGAFGVVGGLFVAGGVLLWSKRIQREKDLP